IPGKDSMLFSVLIQQEEAGRFRGVAWCVQYFDREASNAKSFPVGGVVDIVVRFGFGTVHDRGSRSRGKINVTRYEVGVEMGFKYILDFRAASACQLKIRFRFAQRINYGRLAV